ncbi:hypothetical protein [Streptomyces sp. Ru73]|uniref:hypothetical protein n=1 Tax=Streptomyces sp. Ru73 TaxID=2080748 RepID=UPI0015E47910|nr:hypothetical protein [Streptomyces sp. Ru73]
MALEARTQDLEQDLVAVSAPPPQPAEQEDSANPVVVTGRHGGTINLAVGEGNGVDRDAAYQLGIQRLVHSAAEWGFGAAEAGFPTVPPLSIEWTGDGPSLKYPGRDIFSYLAGRFENDEELERAVMQLLARATGVDLADRTAALNILQRRRKYNRYHGPNRSRLVDGPAHE